jgi:glucose/arabinose dehydrogenase/cytochrome c2
MIIACTPAVLSLASGPDPNAGRRYFRTQCALCHSAQEGDDGGAQGPSLDGVFTRQAASVSGFSYTSALKQAGLTWDAATLSRFLAAPSRVVPGSAMVVAVPRQKDRDNLIAYFHAVKDGTYRDPALRSPADDAPADPAPPSGSKPTTRRDWQNDRPGLVHRINLASLPAPYATPSVSSLPHVVDRPGDAKLALPPGFSINVFSTGPFNAPRVLKVAPNGDVFVSETQGGRISVMRPSADGTRAQSVTVFAQGLVLPFGLAFYPEGDHPRWLYVAENNRIVRYAYQVGDLTARSLPEVVVPEIAPVAGGGHYTRDIAFSQDGRRMFVSVGSVTNAAETMPRKSLGEARSWDAEHGLGTAWGPEENRADVLVFEAGSAARGEVFASGLRNCVGLSIEPVTGNLWCTTSERDMLGDDLVPDFSTRVREGAFYGWPWYYAGNHEDPRLAGQRPDLADKVTVPDVPYQSHSSPLTLTFYTATSGASAFPSQYLGDGFAVMHGSWNRSTRSGYKIVRVRMKEGVPTGAYEDFLVGFITPEGDAWGRPVGTAEAPDGSLLLSEDGHNLIYRISYAKPHRIRETRHRSRHMRLASR